MSGLVSVDYEVFGEVQGVFFRKYTEQEAKKLGLVGWVRNTRQDTVEGQIQGPEEAVEKMTLQGEGAEEVAHFFQHSSHPSHSEAVYKPKKNWLRTTGSPMSRIDKATFNNEHAVSALEFSSFTTRY